MTAKVAEEAKTEKLNLKQVGEAKMSRTWTKSSRLDKSYREVAKKLKEQNTS